MLIPALKQEGGSLDFGLQASKLNNTHTHVAQTADCFICKRLIARLSNSISCEAQFNEALAIV